MSADDSEVKTLRIYSPHLGLVNDILTKLPPHQLDLMRRAYKLSRSQKAKGRPMSDEGALLIHALTVGLTQLHHALYPDKIYHHQARLEFASILHLCIEDQGALAMSEVEKMLSTLEELHSAEE